MLGIGVLLGLSDHGLLAWRLNLNSQVLIVMDGRSLRQLLGVVVGLFDRSFIACVFVDDVASLRPVLKVTST